MRRFFLPLAMLFAAIPALADAPCVEVRAEARYGASGYNHIVHLRNGCDRPYLCSVATDVNPVAVDVTVPPHAEVEVLTFRGSPAYAFVPRVTCRAQ